MTSTRDLMAAGMPAGQANQIGMDKATGLVAAGTTKAGSLALTADVCVFATVSSGKGASLQPSSGAAAVAIYNGGSNALLVYTAIGTSDVINGNSANGGFSVTNGKSAIFMATDGQWVANLSA